MNKFYFQYRNIGTNPDVNKYYFSTIDELINQVELLKRSQQHNNHINFSVSSHNDNQYALMVEYLTTESRGTDIPLKCKGWFVCGYIYTDETTDNIYDLLPKWKADYTNRFIENRYMSPDDYTKLSESELEKCRNEGGIILNR